MIVLQTIAVAFAMFSAVPVPQFEWNAKNMRYALCAFPLIGVVIGALNGFQDQLSLTGIFQWDHSLNSNDYLFKDSRKWPVCQCRKPGLRKKYPLR